MAGRAVVLLSGGLDSATAAAIARREGWELYGLTVRYGQVHAVEIEAARRVGAVLGLIRHLELDVDLRAFGGSALVGEGEIPRTHVVQSPGSSVQGSTNLSSSQLSQVGSGVQRDTLASDAGSSNPGLWTLDPGRSAIPPTYVPARNTVLLSLALAWAEVVRAERIVIGVNALDYSGYPDCRPEYIAAFEYLASLATKAGVEGRPLRIWAPLQHLTKAAIIRVGLELGVDYGLTHSCYDPDAAGRPCGECDSCQLRAKGFAEAGIADPALSRS